jgi:hypothetical protein
MKTKLIPNLVMTLILSIGVFACVSARNHNEVIVINESTHDTLVGKTKHGFLLINPGDTIYVYKIFDKDSKPEVETDPCTNCNK